MATSESLRQADLDQLAFVLSASQASLEAKIEDLRKAIERHAAIADALRQRLEEVRDDG